MSRAVLGVLLLTACGRLGFDGSAADGSTGPDADAGPVPDLVVSFVDDRMSGPPTMSSVDELPPGTVGLSLREALVIASNHAGPDWIGFDASAFAGNPRITIASELVVGDTGTRVDAMGTGVTIAGDVGYAGTLFHVTGNDAVIDGFTLQGGGIGVEATAISGLVVRNLKIYDSGGDSIHVEGGSQLVVEDSIIERAVGSPVLLRAATDAKLRRNFVSLLTKTGDVYGFYLESVNNSQITDNIIDPGTAFLIDLVDSSDNQVVGNILDRGDTGLTILGASQRNFIFRNVVISPNYDSIYVDGAASDNTIINNTLYMAGDVVDGGTNTTTNNNLISSSPANFVDPVAYDFHLVPGSSAIDAATDLGLDMLPDVPARFLGAGPDLGGVESY